MYHLSIGDKSAMVTYSVNQKPNVSGEHYFNTDISQTFCRSAMKFGNFEDLAK